MVNFKKFIYLLILSSCFPIWYYQTTISYAAGNDNPACPYIYGVGCPTGQLLIDKKIQNPKTGEFVDTLSSNQVTYSANQEVFFRIEVKNTGNAALNNIQAQDRLPDYLNFVSGPGSYNTSNKTISWTIDNLNAGESKFFQIKTTIKPQNELPQYNILCLTNYAQAQQNQQVAQDTAVFCLQAQILKSVPVVYPVEELPKTGLPIAAWALSGLLPVGIALKRYGQSKRSSQTDPYFVFKNREFSKD